MSSLSFLLSCVPVGCFINKENHRTSIQYFGVSVNGNSCFSKTKIDHGVLLVSHKKKGGFRNRAYLGSQKQDGYNNYNIPIDDEQNLPTKQQKLDDRQGVITEDSGYMQTVSIRASEVGRDAVATIETIFNLLQEIGLNQFWRLGLIADGFGRTHGMKKHNLVWIISKMQLEVDRYPVWGEKIEIETWYGTLGRNTLRRDWVLRSQASGLSFATGTSTWILMNKQTRRLSKIPEEVRAEISPFFSEKKAIKEDVNEKIEKLTEKAKYVTSDLKPMWSDVDLNDHVNNVKFLKWILEAVPEEFMKDHQISSVILEYKRECKSCDVVQSLCEPQEDWKLGFHNEGPSEYTHLLQIQGDTKHVEIARARTLWKTKMSTMPFST